MDDRPRDSDRGADGASPDEPHDTASSGSAGAGPSAPDGHAPLAAPLAAQPTRARRRPFQDERVESRPLWMACVPTLVGVAWSLVAVYGLETYGWALFCVLPSVIGLCSGYIGARLPLAKPRDDRGLLLTIGSLTAVAFALLATGVEGLICLVMALPIVMVFTLPGLVLGRHLGSVARSAARRRAHLVALAVPLFPFAALVEHGVDQPPSVRRVVTSVLVDAPIERVFATVVAFPRIESEPGWLFRAGVAFPIEAHIEGSGVGAVRSCVFSTGTFVEPITAWEAPHLLAFDVTACPPPLHELSFHDHVHAPHLDGYLVAHRGQFRLEQRGDQVLLEGTTWYSHDLAPGWYWGAISDWIVHRIHERVLEHIAAVAEE